MALGIFTSVQCFVIWHWATYVSCVHCWHRRCTFYRPQQYTRLVRETSSTRGTSTGTRNSCKRAVSVLHTSMGVKRLSAGIRGVHAEVGGKTCGSTGKHGSFDVNQEHRRFSCVAALSTHAWSNPMACTRLQLRRYTVSWICAKQRQLWKQLFARLKPRVAKSVACPAASCVGQ